MVHVKFEGLRGETGLTRLLKQAAQAALDHQGSEKEQEISIVLGNDALLQRLNQKHLGDERATDVLSFPGEAINPETELPYLGDIAISIERAEVQAKAGNHNLEEELSLLVVHGVLHLMGHDHAKVDEKERMWAAQAEILTGLGIDLSPQQQWEGQG